MKLAQDEKKPSITERALNGISLFRIPMSAVQLPDTLTIACNYFPLCISSKISTNHRFFPPIITLTFFFVQQIRESRGEWQKSTTATNQCVC